MGMIEDIRAKHPEYNDMNDDALADALHAKFYADMPKEQFHAKLGHTPGRQIGSWEAAGRGALQGLSFNTSDEIYAGYRGLKNMLTPRSTEDLVTGRKGGFSGGYDQGLKEVRDANALAAEQNPGANLGGELVGGAVPALAATVGTALFPGLAPVAEAADAKTAAQAYSLWNRIKGGAKTGAVLGSAYGAGGYEGADGESLTDSALGRLGGGAKGAVAGAAAGAVLTPAIDAVASTGGALANQVRAQLNPERFARQKAAEALRRGFSDQGHPSMAARGEVRQLAASSPNAVLGDVGGDPVKTLVRTALNRPNAQNEPFLKMLDTRQGNQWREIEDNLGKTIGDPNAYGAVKLQNEMNRSENAKKAYTAAYKADFEPSKELWKLFEQDDKGAFIRPTMGRVMKNVEDRMRDIHGSEAADAANQNGLQIVHQIKTEIDHQIGQARKVASRGDSSTSDKYDLASLVDLKKQIIYGIEKSGGGAPKLYLNANKNFANSKALENALELGRDLAQKPADVIRNAISDLGQAERQHFKLGLSRGLADRNRKPDVMRDRIGPHWRSPEDEFRLDTIFEDQAPQMRGALNAMEKARDLRRAATGNSTTAKQLMANADAKQEAERAVGAINLAKNVGLQNWHGVLNQALNSTKARIEGISPRVAEEILRIFGTSANQHEAADMISKLVKSAQDAAINHHAVEVRRGLVSKAATRTAISAMPNDRR
jgi:hypothetical protein